MQVVPHASRTLNAVVDEVVEIVRAKRRFARLLAYDEAAPRPARQPAAPDQLLVGLAHRVVVHLALPSERANARQLVTCVELSCRDQEDDLLGKLLLERDVALLAQRNLHRRPRGNVAVRLSRTVL